jgi:hypothetical protein
MLFPLICEYKVSCTAKKTLLNHRTVWNLFVSGLQNSVPGPEKEFPGKRTGSFYYPYYSTALTEVFCPYYYEI